MTTTPRRRMRSASVGLGLTVMMAAALTGCSGDDPDYSAICVDPHTNQRLPDRDCGRGDHPRDYDGGGGFYWFYMNSHSGHRVPAVGSSYNRSWGTYNGSRLASKYAVQRGGLPTKGASSFKTFSKSGGFSKSTGTSRSGFSKSGGFGGSHSSSSS